MQMQHWLFLGLVLVAGYAAGRFFPAPGQMIGLP